MTLRPRVLDNMPFKSLPHIEPTGREVLRAKACRAGYYHAIDGWAHDNEWDSLSVDEKYAWVEAARHVYKTLTYLDI